MAAGGAAAFWVEAVSHGGIRPVALAEPRPDEVLVETLYSGISRGTETLVFRGGVPASQIRAMRCPFQEGEFPAPVKYGYAAVGRVLAGPAGLRDRTVFALHPHQTHFVVPVAAAVPLPDGLPPEHAVLAANMETALNGLWDAGITAGDRVCIIGAGVVGLLLASLAARVPGVHPVVLDIDPAKAEAAVALGVAFAADSEDIGRFDRIIHVSGNPQGLCTALGLADFEALILEMSWYGDREVILPLGEAFHSRRLALKSSQVGAVAPSHRERFTRRARLELALDLLTDGACTALISGESPFAALPQVMARLADGTLPALCHRIRY